MARIPPSSEFIITRHNRRQEGTLLSQCLNQLVLPITVLANRRIEDGDWADLLQIRLPGCKQRQTAFVDTAIPLTALPIEDFV